MSTATMAATGKASFLAGIRDQQSTTERMTVTAYQQANPGAVAAYRGFADPQLLHHVSAIAVSAGYPGVTIGSMDDPADQGLAVNEREVQRFAEVDCIVQRTTETAAGVPVDPQAIDTPMCQRTGSGLTVQLFGDGFHGTADQSTMVGLTNDVWKATIAETSPAASAAGPTPPTMTASGSANPASTALAPINMPQSLPGFEDVMTASRQEMSKSKKGSAEGKAIILARETSQNKINTLTTAAYEQANPGAAAAYRSYAQPDLSQQVTVIAVRRAYPGLTIGPIDDPARLGVAVSLRQIEAVDRVECEVDQTDPTPSGALIDPSKDRTAMCQRTGPGLTVQVYGAPFQGAGGQAMMVALTNSAWTQISD